MKRSMPEPGEPGYLQAHNRQAQRTRSSPKTQKVTQEFVDEAKGWLREVLEPHVGHTLRQVGRCVYCDDCDTRAFDGRL